jgi:3-isopropylmalate/(R)-2-methylmalate dehydratase small subunit
MADVVDDERRNMITMLERNTREFGITYFGLGDRRRGIQHQVGPEQGLAQPGVIILCSDSHTSAYFSREAEMEPFVTLKEKAVPIDMDNVDNDQVIPARLMRKPRSDGMYGTYWFHDLRFNEDGSEKPDFILNNPAFRGARIVVASKNYACSSSRLGSVYAHYDYGIRALIAVSFGDVFYNNCLKNGILPVRLDEQSVAKLRRQLHEQPGASIAIDLPQQTVTGPDGAVYPFEVDVFAKHCLLEGLSDIKLTLEHERQIEAFENSYRQKMPWLF